jgi:hypothetical protein
MRQRGRGPLAARWASVHVRSQLRQRHSVDAVRTFANVSTIPLPQNGHFSGRVTRTSLE